MADLGAVGTQLFRHISTSLGREKFLENRSLYKASARLLSELAFCAYYESDAKRLGGSIQTTDGYVSREIRVVHRGTGSVVARTHSQPGGTFMVSVPPDMTLDVHLLAEPEDGCDAYLPNRTPV